MAVAPTAIDIATEFVDGLAAQDFERVGRCLAPDVAFHAVVPGTGSFRERTGAEETARQLQAWLGDADPLELLESSVTPLVDKVRVSYRFAAFEEEKWHVVEQQAYAVVGAGGIERLDLVCCGFQVVPERPER